MLGALTIDGGSRVGLVRVAANHANAIGRALDVGAAGDLLSLRRAQDAAVAVAASCYPPVAPADGLMRASMCIGRPTLTPPRRSWR